MSKELQNTLISVIVACVLAAFTIVFSTNLPIFAVILLLAATIMNGIIFFSLMRAKFSRPSNIVSSTTDESQPNSNWFGIIIAGLASVILIISTIYAISRIEITGQSAIYSPETTATPYKSDSQSDAGLVDESVSVEVTPNGEPLVQNSAVKSTYPYKGRIAAGNDFTAMLTEDGKVICIGNESDIYVENWENIKQISANQYHILGLYENGTVAFSGSTFADKNQIADWKNIVQVATCYEGCLGLTTEGKVLFKGFDFYETSECQTWNGIVRIFDGDEHILGLTNTGEVVTAGGPDYNRTNISGFYDVVDGCAGNGSSFIVLSDGSAIARGVDNKGEDFVGSWTDIVSIACGDEHTVGLKSDGTVVAIGSNYHNQCNINEWTDIVAITCGPYHTVGLKSDGTLVATGMNDRGQCDVDGIDLW